jgi:hypothetical protein
VGRKPEHVALHHCRSEVAEGVGLDPQVLSDNGFQVMSTPSWLFLSETDWTYCAGQFRGLLPDWPGFVMAFLISS